MTQQLPTSVEVLPNHYGITDSKCLYHVVLINNVNQAKNIYKLG